MINEDASIRGDSRPVLLCDAFRQIEDTGVAERNVSILLSFLGGILSLQR